MTDGADTVMDVASESVLTWAWASESEDADDDVMGVAPLELEQWASASSAGDDMSERRLGRGRGGQGRRGDKRETKRRRPRDLAGWGENMVRGDEEDGTVAGIAGYGKSERQVDDDLEGMPELDLCWESDSDDAERCSDLRNCHGDAPLVQAVEPHRRVGRPRTRHRL